MKEQSSNPCEKVSFILTYDQLEAAYNIYQEQFISCDFIRRSLERLEEGIGLCNLPYETLHDDPNLLHEACIHLQYPVSAMNLTLFRHKSKLLRPVLYHILSYFCSL